MENSTTKIMGINRFRMGTDGKGITTLVAFKGCPLNCQYCINPKCHQDNAISFRITPEELLLELTKDDIYFRMSGGGITFGGGEPLLHSAYILQLLQLVPRAWGINMETSLNVEWEKIKPLLPYVNMWYIDIKDSNPDIYLAYTGKHNIKVIENSTRLSCEIGKEHIVFRIPNIPEYNTEKDILYSVSLFEQWGMTERLQYSIY